MFYDEESQEMPSRVLTEEEYMERLKYRVDIFAIKSDERLCGIEAACLAAGIASGLWLTKQEIATVAGPDFYPKIPQEYSVRMVDSKEISAALQTYKRDIPSTSAQLPSSVKTIRKNHAPGPSGHHNGGGDPTQRITKLGILGLLAGKVVGKSVANADIFGKGGFTSGIDAIIEGKSCFKTGGETGIGRRGESGIGFGVGVNSGMDGPGIGGDDLISLMLDGSGDLTLSQISHKPSHIAISEPTFQSGSAMVVGGRSRGSIMRVVMQNLVAIRYAYNKRLIEKPGLKGKITCKFAIDEFGKIVFCEITGSTIADAELEEEVVGKIRTWVFEKIDKPGDVTEVVYPLAFSQ